MFELTDQQKMARQMFRSWVDRHLAPRVEELETGTVPPYDLMRKMGEDLGIFSLARTRFERMAAHHVNPNDTGDGDGDGDGFDASFADLLSIEISRHCPAFILSFGADLDLAGGAAMTRVTPAQRRRYD